MTTRSPRCLATILLALPLAAGAQAQTPSATLAPIAATSCLIAPGARDVPEPSPFAPNPRRETLVGIYACEEGSFRIALRLEADGSFTEELASTEAPDPFQEKISGRWHLDGPELHLRNAPGRPPVLTRDRTLRDPRVLVSVSASQADGRPADDLDVVVDLAKGQLHGSLADAPYRLEQSALARMGSDVGGPPRTVTVYRHHDDTPLARLPLTARGPNSFHFIYRPGDTEAFEQEGLVVSASRGVLILGVGQGATYIRRVSTP